MEEHNDTGSSLIVADNASTDNSIALLREKYKNVQIIPLNENHGFAKGYNEALAKVNEEILVLLNSDVEVTADWLSPILELFTPHDDESDAMRDMRYFSDSFAHNNSLYHYKILLLHCFALLIISY